MPITFDLTPPLGAFLWGIFSSVSLFIGSFIGIYFNVSTKATSVLMAFGAGALLFALSIEIYGVAVCDFENDEEKDRVPLVMLAVGSILGSVIFSVSNYLVETKGRVFRAIQWDNEWVSSVLGFFCARFRTQNTADAYEIEDGSVPAITVDSSEPLAGGKSEEANLLGYGATSETKDDHAPTTPQSRKNSLSASTMRNLRASTMQSPGNLRKSVRMNMRQSVLEAPEVVARGIDASVGIAIWLGMLIDGIPEAFVIGILVAEGNVSFTFILSVFISNIPESLASSSILRKAKVKRWVIIVMWAAIVCIAGVGAAIGAVSFDGEQTYGKIMAAKLIEGLAAGAMLVIIAEANLPEAFHNAGSVVGFATLMGFLTAYFVRLSEL